LERPKYQLKVIDSNAKYAFDARITNSAVIIHSDLVPSRSLNLDVGFASYPNRDYPINYGGNYISDLPDNFEFGHFAAGIPARTIDFVACAVNGYAPFAVQFINKSFGASSYIWDYGDNSTDLTSQRDVFTGSINPVHVYDQSGIYTVTLTGFYGQFGLKSTKLGYIIVNGFPMTADFDASTKSGYAPLLVTFTNLSVNGTTYQWQFGSGSTTSTAADPTFIYNDPGIYGVSLTAYTKITQSNGCQSQSINSYVATHISTSYINVMAVQGNCNGPYSNSIAGGSLGKYPFSSQYTYNLGNLTTPVTFSYNAGTASRYVVTIGGITQYDSLWVSMVQPTQTVVNTINNALGKYGPHPIPSFISASLTNVTLTGNNQQFFFTKTTGSIWAAVQVYNPFNISCSFTMSCPTPAPSPVTNPGTTPCGGLLSVDGRQVAISPYYTDYPVQLGGGTGIVALYYDALDVPDRFQVIYDGAIVMDTYWRGLQSYRSALNALGFTEPIYTNPNYTVGKSHPTPGSGTGSFLKTTSTPYAVLRVYSPLGGTRWSATLMCPV